MTSGQRGDDTNERVAGIGFVAFLALAGGVIGLLVAAAAVATERAWTGRRSTAPAREQLRRARAADNRAWLARDAAEQAAWRQARRDWWQSGADPATAPATPGVWRRAGTAVRRAWARTAVRASDFRDGWRDGWQAADRVRRDGGGFGAVARARPDLDRRPSDEATPDRTGSTTYYRAVCHRCEWAGELTTDYRDMTDQQDAHRCPDGAKPPVADNVDESTLAREDTLDEQPDLPCCPIHHKPVARVGDWEYCPSCEDGKQSASTNQPSDTTTEGGNRMASVAEVNREIRRSAPDCPSCHTPMTPLDDADSARDGGLSPNGRRVRYQCDTCHADTHRVIDANTTASSNGGTMTTQTAPQTDSNAAVMAAQLGAINAGNQQISDLTDQLARLRAEQEARVRSANEFAESTGQTAQTKTALDAATAVNAQLGQHLGAFSDAAEVAAEETNAAQDGLTPVIHAEDTLTQAGADGRAVAAATNA